MEDDSNEVQEWINEHGSITSYAFMVYGPMTVKDNAIINKGLTMTMVQAGLGELRYVQITEDVDSDIAEMYSLNRGWNIQWVFPGEAEHEVIPDTIKEGLEFLRLEYEYLGKMGGNGNV